MTDDPRFELCPECGTPHPLSAKRCPSCGASRTRARDTAPVPTPETEVVWTRVERATVVFTALSAAFGGLQLWLNPAARHLQLIGSAVVIGASLGVLRSFRKRNAGALAVWAGFVTTAAAATLLGRAVWTFALSAPALHRAVGWGAVLNAVAYAWTLRRAIRELSRG